MMGDLNSQEFRMPEPGDVIFTYSGGREAFRSCLLQRLLFDDWRGRWWSHVAIALSGRIAIEASTALEEGETTWSGATLGKGVRLRLLPDLIFSAKARAVLRHPNASLTEEKFAIRTPHIALMLGSGYSTKPLVNAAREASVALAALVPEGAFDWNADSDHIGQELRDNEELRAGLERHLRKGEGLYSMNDYFCSQLAGVLLWRGGLLEKDPGNPTPCGLFDLLKGAGWHDITDSAYGEKIQAYWQRTPCDDWVLKYREDVALADWFRDAVHASPMIALIQETVDKFAGRLDAIRGKLDEQRRS